LFFNKLLLFCITVHKSTVIHMAIIINLDVMMSKRKMSLNELSEHLGITLSNLSLLKTGKTQGIKYSTLNKLCRLLECQPADLLEYRLLPGETGEPII